MKRTASLAALASSVLLLGSCHVNNGKLDMSWVGDRINEAQNDEVVVEGSASAGPTVAVPTQGTDSNGVVTAHTPDAPMASAPAAKAAKAGTYTVKPGDTLNGIAARHHSSPAAIANANRITAPDKLSVGQVLRIPAVSAKPAAKKATVPASRYAVRQGDTLSGISRRTGVPVQQLMRANNMTTPNLRAGSTITIPKH